ncbi:MAG: hypothetical protein KBB67_09825 [Syntrophorhabdus sp.]|jgi:transposase|nr:hypothetical protein [Syntrophorhabdus sp.]
MSPVEVMTSVKRRRRWSAAQKRAMVEEAVVPLPEVRELKTKVCEPERILSKKTMEVEILKDAIEIAREEKLIVRMPVPPTPACIADTKSLQDPGGDAPILTME